jgi:hypothetical protein
METVRDGMVAVSCVPQICSPPQPDLCLCLAAACTGQGGTCEPIPGGYQCRLP